MNPYIWPCTCCVCGGEGLMNIGEIGMNWLYMYSHADPRVCADNLRRERQEAEEKKAKAANHP